MIDNDENKNEYEDKFGYRKSIDDNSSLHSFEEDYSAK